MTEYRTVREFMVDVFDYPHMPYWFTLRQAAGIMKKTVVEAQKCIQPQVILVFDEKYTLIGTLSLKDILRGLAPCLKRNDTATGEGCIPPDEKTLAALESILSGAESKALLDKPISTVMEPVKASVSPEDNAVKAAVLMESGDLRVLPVLENQKKLVGIVRLLEVFQELSNRMMVK